MKTSSRLCNACGMDNPSQAAFCMACGGPMEAGMPIPSNATGLIRQDQLLKHRYRILTQIGRGGFAAVYKAEDSHFYQRPVAVKEMSQSGLSPQERVESVDAFTREAQLLAGLQHPHLPRIYDHFPEGGRWYLVMDFIKGETLENVLLRQVDQRLSLGETLDIGLQLCSVLHYLHTCHPPIIFRDLKPANIMYTPSKHLYLIDFGIARHFKPGQTKDTIPFGSPGYAAPEQYGKSQTPPQSDIYSMGVLLHHLLSGEDPSEKPFLLAPLRLAGSEAPTGLERLVERMKQLDAARRPSSIAEVQAELQALADGSAEKRGGVFTLPTPLDEPYRPERSRERERRGAIQEQASERPVNYTRRRLMIGGLLTGAALAIGAGSLLTISPASHSPSQKASPTPLPVKGYAETSVMFGYDAQHTYFNSSERILSPTNVSRLTIAWTAQPTGGFVFASSPTVSGDTVYAVSDNGCVYALDAATGQSRWVSDPHWTADVSSNFTPAVVNGIVYVCLPDQKLYAYDAQSGRLRWSSPTTVSVEVDSPPTVVDGVVYVTGAITGPTTGAITGPTGNDHVWAFDAATGQKRWVSDSAQGFAYSSPTVAQGLIFVSSFIYDANESRIYAFDAATGQKRWTSDSIVGGIDVKSASVAAANGMVYISSGFGGVAAFDAASGHSRWVITPNGGTASGSAPALANGSVYTSLIDGRVYALDAMSGKLRWLSDRIAANAGDTPVVANGVLYIGSGSIESAHVGSVFALDATTGRTLWISPPQTTRSAPHRQSLTAESTLLQGTEMGSSTLFTCLLRNVFLSEPSIPATFTIAGSGKDMSSVSLLSPYAILLTY